MTDSECLKFVISCLEAQGYAVNFHVHSDRGAQRIPFGTIQEYEETLTLTATRRFWDGN